jgi:uncharacterized membrane protein
MDISHELFYEQDNFRRFHRFQEKNIFSVIAKYETTILCYFVILIPIISNHFSEYSSFPGILIKFNNNKNYYLLFSL